MVLMKIVSILQIVLTSYKNIKRKIKFISKEISMNKVAKQVKIIVFLIKFV